MIDGIRLVMILVCAALALAICTSLPSSQPFCDDECRCKNDCEHLNLTFSQHMGHGVPHLRKCFCFNLTDEIEVWKGKGGLK